MEWRQHTDVRWRPVDQVNISARKGSHPQLVLSSPEPRRHPRQTVPSVVRPSQVFPFPNLPRPERVSAEVLSSENATLPLQSGRYGYDLFLGPECIRRGRRGAVKLILFDWQDVGGVPDGTTSAKSRLEVSGETRKT